MSRRLVALALVLVMVTIPVVPAAQVATTPTAACHVTDGAFTSCPSGDMEWGDVEPLSFVSNSFMYANQDAARTALFLMFDYPARTTPIGPNQAVRISFDTMGRAGSAPRFERHDIDIFGDGRVQVFVFGQAVTPNGIAAAIGFGPSPHSTVPHVRAELQVPFGPGGVTPDPLFWSSTLPPPPPLLFPSPDPTGKTVPFIGSMNQLADRYAHIASVMVAAADLCTGLTRSPACAVFVPTGAVFADASVRVRALATDATDPNFRVVVQPVVRSLSVQPLSAGQGLTQQEADALNALLGNVEESIAFAEATFVSASRVQGAKSAGDTLSERQQREAVRRYALNLATRLDAQASFLDAVDDAFRSAGIFFSFTSSDIINFQSDVLAGGLPPEFTQALTELGADAAAQHEISVSIVTGDSDSIATLGLGIFPGAVSDPSTGAALREAAIGLKQFAAMVAATGLKPALNVTLHGDYVAAGVGLRDKTAANISLSSLPPGGNVVQALLYWGMLANGEGSSLSHLNFNGNPIAGDRVGSGRDTCWERRLSFVYRADVTPFVTGNGTYALTGVASGGGIVLAQGASLVVLYERAGDPVKTIIAHDGDIVFVPPSGASTTTITSFLAATPVSATTSFIVGDGQPQFAERASFTGSAGTLALTNPFVGGDGAHWDTDTVDVSSQVGAGSTVSSAEIRFEVDCLMWAAQMFSVATNSPVTLPKLATAALVEANESGKTTINLRGVRAEDALSLEERVRAVVIDRVIENPSFDAAEFTRQILAGLVADGQLSQEEASSLFNRIMTEVNALDRTPPVISGLSTFACNLWPPNHKLVRMAVVRATDLRSGIASFSVTGTSNEPSGGDPDIVISGVGLDPRVVWLRAERQGSGGGRVYTVTATATDRAGNSATSQVTCAVPHDRGRGRR